MFIRRRKAEKSVLAVLTVAAAPGIAADAAAVAGTDIAIPLFQFIDVCRKGSLRRALLAFFLDFFDAVNIIGEEGSDSMAVRLNDDKEMVAMIREGLKRTGGYCPCRLERTEENKCICKEFREQMEDPDFKGFCHCMLYYKD